MAETILVSGPFENDRYKIVSGHHKWDGAKILRIDEVPCMVLPPMTDDEIAFWIVKMNVSDLISGRAGEGGDGQDLPPTLAAAYSAADLKVIEPGRASSHDVLNLVLPPVIHPP